MMSVTSIDNRVTSFTDGILINSGNIDTLNNILTSHMVCLSANSDTISAIDNRVTSFTDGIATNS